MRKLAVAFAAMMIPGAASAAPVLNGAFDSIVMTDAGSSALGTMNVGILANSASGDSVLGSGAPSNLVPVPEPSTWAMMIVGFGVVGAASRRRVRSVGASFA